MATEPSSNSDASANSKQHPVEICGYILKLGHVRKNWKRRWFCLCGRELAYYVDDTANKRNRKGVIYLSPGTRVSPIADREGGIFLDSYPKSFTLVCEDKEQTGEWMKKIRRASKFSELDVVDGATINFETQRKLRELRLQRHEKGTKISTFIEKKSSTDVAVVQPTSQTSSVPDVETVEGEEIGKIETKEIKEVVLEEIECKEKVCSEDESIGLAIPEVDLLPIEQQKDPFVIEEEAKVEESIVQPVSTPIDEVTELNETCIVKKDIENVPNDQGEETEIRNPEVSPVIQLHLPPTPIVDVDPFTLAPIHGSKVSLEPNVFVQDSTFDVLTHLQHELMIDGLRIERKEDGDNETREGNNNNKNIEISSIYDSRPIGVDDSSFVNEIYCIESPAPFLTRALVPSFVLTVGLESPDHHFDFSSLSEALSSPCCLPGCRIEIHPGFYVDKVVISVPGIHIIGKIEGSDDKDFSSLVLNNGANGEVSIEEISKRLPVISFNGTGSTVMVDSPHASISRLFVDHGFCVSSDQQKPYAAITVKRGIFILDQSVVRSSGYAVVGSGASTLPVLRNSIIMNSFSGVLLHSDCHARLENVLVFSVRFNGITVKSGACPLVVNCKIANCDKCGILVNEAGGGHFYRNEIRSCSLYGIKCSKDANKAVFKKNIVRMCFGGISCTRSKKDVHFVQNILSEMIDSGSCVVLKSSHSQFTENACVASGKSACVEIVQSGTSVFRANCFEYGPESKVLKCCPGCQDEFIDNSFICT